MNEKIICILLIAAIVLSFMSVAITLAFDENSLSDKQTTIIKESESQHANVGFVVEDTNKNS